jgi:hypothetical protein
MTGAEANHSPPTEGERAVRAIALGLALGVVIALAARMRRQR